MLRFLEIGQAPPRLSTSHITRNHDFRVKLHLFPNRCQQCKHHDYSFADLGCGDFGVSWSFRHNGAF
jgi:hypothetical protein